MRVHPFFGEAGRGTGQLTIACAFGGKRENLKKGFVDSHF
jgi:hypothetical protein